MRSVVAGPELQCRDQEHDRPYADVDRRRYRRERPKVREHAHAADDEEGRKRLAHREEGPGLHDAECPRVRNGLQLLRKLKHLLMLKYKNGSI